MTENRASQNSSVPKFTLAFLFILYCATASFAAKLAIAVHTPCASDFEGGCGHGKVWAGALSWLAACAAIGMAVGIAAFSSAVPPYRLALILAAAVLALPCIAYVLYGLYMVAPVVVQLLR
ncbi:hypothetical protein LJR129_004135 [Acidovorax sp. LjRoot129]|uniref:hypothetical protein n=1 Tax=Acidovorax sp. LjRoot129 TaxID=3342260 RepID=UPI003ECE0106